ncbi:MAG: ion transporter [Myxococcales bacterium]|nr:ion transporter [Myxococcales bacterium]
MALGPHPTSRGAWREQLRIIIFEADTRAGKVFDVALLVAIVLSVVAVMLDSVTSIRSAHGAALRSAEWVFTLLFTVEYALRLLSVPRAGSYARSFFGIVDLLAIIPTYLSVVFPGAQSLLVIRALRLLRIFRVFKLGRFLGEANLLNLALRSSRHKVVVFLGTVLVLVTILGAAMYLIEGEQGGFTSIPVSVYWAIVTMTTVGYGDIAPQTILGQALASLVMILGYSIIAVPTGILTAELVDAAYHGRGERPLTTRTCPHCMSEGHEQRAQYCKDCGAALDSTPAT